MAAAGISIPADIAAAAKALGRNPETHHVLPWIFRDKFAHYGMNVNDAKYGSHVVGGANIVDNAGRKLAGTHQSWSKAYNDNWREFLRNVNPVNSLDFIRQVEDYARKLSRNPAFDGYGKAGTVEATGFPINF